MGQDLWPPFKAPRISFGTSYSSNVRNCCPQLSAWLGLPSVKRKCMPVSQVPHHSNLSCCWRGLYPKTLDNLGQRGDKSGHELFLGWHAKFCQAVPVSIPVTLELFQAREARSCDSNHSKSLMSVQSSQHIASSSSFIPPSLTGHSVGMWVLWLHLSKP